MYKLEHCLMNSLSFAMYFSAVIVNHERILKKRQEKLLPFNSDSAMFYIMNFNFVKCEL